MLLPAAMISLSEITMMSGISRFVIFYTRRRTTDEHMTIGSLPLLLSAL